MTQPRNLGAFADNLNTSGQVSLTTGVSGTLPVANGGTGQTSLSSVSVGSATSATTATNLASGSAGVIPYQTGSGATSFTAAGTSGQVLTSAGAGTPTWTTPSAGAMTLISTQTASGVSNLAWTGLSGYDKYYLIYETIQPSTSSVVFVCYLGYGGSPTYVTSQYQYQYIKALSTISSGSTNAGSFPLAGAGGFYATGGYGMFGNLLISGVNSLSLINFSGNSFTYNGANSYEIDINNGAINFTNALTAIKIQVGSGTFTGSASLYGISS